ncbi:hypothetical protein PTI98_010447 [Pleurotus ostreatus]|nr:hypothetical protein PTI98_010447 [Pleurotus ostreatus]
MSSSTENDASDTGVSTSNTNQLLQQCRALLMTSRRCVADIWTHTRFLSSNGIRWASRALSCLLRSLIVSSSAVKNWYKDLVYVVYVRNSKSCTSSFKRGPERDIPSPSMSSYDNISDRIKGPYTGPERVVVESSGSWQGKDMRPQPSRSASDYGTFERQAAALFTQVSPETVAEVLPYMDRHPYESAEGSYTYGDHGATTSGHNEYLTSPVPHHAAMHYFQQPVQSGAQCRAGLYPISIPQPPLLDTPSPVPGFASPSSTTSTWSYCPTSAARSDQLSPSSPLFDKLPRSAYSPREYSPLASRSPGVAHGYIWPPVPERIVSPQELHATESVASITRQGSRFREKVTSEATARAAGLKRKKEATFRCELCGVMLTAKHNLTRHENAHRGIKPFGCRCGASFTTKADRKRHLKTRIQSTCRELTPDAV